MIDKRELMRDYRVARMGLSRRIRLRIRSTSAPTVASVDPLSDAAPSPSTDTLRYITGQFTLLKTDQDYAETGVTQKERGIVHFHSMFNALIQQAYLLDIGGTKKSWVKKSVPEWDDSRCAMRMFVEAQQ